MESEQYHKLYETIQNLDPKIRFVTIIDYEGRLLFGGQKEGVTDYLSPGFQKESLRHAMDAWKLRDKYSDFIGKGKYAIAAYEKIKRITVPLKGNKLIYFTTEPEADHDTDKKYTKNNRIINSSFYSNPNFYVMLLLDHDSICLRHFLRFIFGNKTCFNLLILRDY